MNVNFIPVENLIMTLRQYDDINTSIFFKNLDHIWSDLTTFQCWKIEGIPFDRYLHTQVR